MSDEPNHMQADGEIGMKPVEVPGGIPAAVPEVPAGETPEETPAEGAETPAAGEGEETPEGEG